MSYAREHQNADLVDRAAAELAALEFDRPPVEEFSSFSPGVCIGCGHHTEVDFGDLCRKCGDQDLKDSLDDWWWTR